MAKLKFIIEGDTTSSDVALNSTRAKLNQISSTAIGASKQFAKYGSIAIAASTAILIATTKQSLAQIDQLAKTADQMGLTTEALATFQHLGELTGVSNEKMNSSLERMVKRLGEASGGMGAAKKTLEELNLNATELIQLSPDEQYRKIAEEIRGLSTASEKAAAVAAIFGREGVALLNTIEAGDEAFIEAARDAELFGTAVSRIDAAQVEAANDSFERVQEVLKGVSRTITVQLAPILKVISDRFVESARESEGFSETVTSGIQKAAEAVAFLGDVIRGLEVVWKIVEVAAIGFISVTLTALDELNKAGAAALNWIPGVDITPSPALSEWAEESRRVLEMTNDELDELVSKPMPSDNIKQFFEDVKKEAEVAALKIAEARKQAAKPVEEEEGDGRTSKEISEAQKVIDANEAKYAKLTEMREQFELSEEEQEIAKFERQEEEFGRDLELMLERGVLIDEAVAIQKQAREDAEAIHQNNMLNIQNSAMAEGLRFQKLTNAEKLKATIETGASILGAVSQNNKVLFNLNKAFSLAKIATTLPSAVISSFERAGGYPWGVVPAGLMAAAGASQIAKISGAKYGGSQAHGGLDHNPEEGTFLLRRDEMVLDPGTSKEVRENIRSATAGPESGRSITIGQITLNAKFDPRDMTEEELDELVEIGLAPAIKRGVDALLDFGLTPAEETA